MLNHFTLPEEIITDQVILKRRSHEYDKNLFRLIDNNRLFLREFLYWVDSVENLESVINTTDKFSEDWNRQDSFEYVYLDPQSQKLVGAGGVHTVDYKNHAAELGYYLDKEATGHGYVSSFVREMEKALFTKGIHRLVITCDSQNLPSANVAQRCNFTYEGTLKGHELAYGKFHDTMVFAKINEQD